MARSDAILCITTGGSIDKTYSTKESAFVVGAPAARHVLREARCTCAVKYKEVCRKDSLELTDEDRSLIVSTVETCEESIVVITHGTDTMAQTALACESIALKLAKTVVLTGAMRPASFRDSDAVFNLGYAMGVAPLLAPGAHVAMNGRVFTDARSLKKDTSRDVFVDDHDPFVDSNGRSEKKTKGERKKKPATNRDKKKTAKAEEAAVAGEAPPDSSAAPTKDAPSARPSEARPPETTQDEDAKKENTKPPNRNARGGRGRPGRRSAGRGNNNNPKAAETSTEPAKPPEAPPASS